MPIAYQTGSRTARFAYPTGSRVPQSVARAAAASAGVAPAPPLQITNGFEQPPKPGGLEITNGFEPANPAPGALQITNGFDTPATPPATGAGVQPAASALGVPPDAAAQMTRGFPMPGGIGPKPEGFANGGMVRGPGTGTSDSVKDAVPPGTYIMPADSTRQIGEQNMAGFGFRPGMMQAAQAADPGPRLGFKSRSQREKEGIESPPGAGLGFHPRGKVPVNLSNGEYKVPPEQVQAIGEQVLDAMNVGTHTPSNQGEEVGEEKPASDSLYFADGGMVPFDEDIRNIAEKATGGYGLRRDGTPKGQGFLGPLATNDGSTMTEFSGEATVNGKPMLFPLVTPNQGFKDLSNVLAGGHPSAEMYDRAIQHAESRRLTGRSPFASLGEQQKYGQNFADGGMVEDPKKRDPFAYQAPGSAATAARPGPIPGAERGDLPVQDTARASYGQIGGPAAVKPAAPTTSPIQGPLDSMGAAYGEAAKKLTFGAFDSKADAIRAKNREGLIAEPEMTSAPASPPAQPGTPTASPAAPGVSPAAAQPAIAAPAGAATSAPGIRRIDEPGKSPLFTNVEGDGASGTAPQPRGLGFRPGMGTGTSASPAAPEPGLGFRPGMGSSSPDVMGILQRESKIRGEMAGLRDQIAFNEGSGGSFRKTTNDEIVRDMLTRGNAGDRSAALGFMAGRQDAGTKQDMGQQELALRQQEAAARQGIAAGEFGLKQEAQGFQSAAQRRLGALQDQYQAETDPEKRGAIAKQIHDLNGKQDNRFTVVPGGQEWDTNANAMRTVPSRVINNQTGQFVDQTQASGDPRQQEGAKLRGKDGKMYQVKNGVPVPV